MTRQILVIDDDDAIRSTISTILTSSGYEVICAADGKEGVDLFLAYKPDLVITDLIMPGQEGIETIHVLKQAQPAAKIIAMSGGGRIASGNLLSIARGFGVDHIIAKPFDIDGLIAVVQLALS